jgi:Recombinase
MREDKVKKKLVIDTDKGTIVADIYRMKRIGLGRSPMGYNGIVAHLNASGVTLRARKFNISDIQGLHTCTTSRGEYDYGLWDMRNKVRRSDDECQIIAVSAIVSDAEWQEFQMGIASNARRITPMRTVSSGRRSRAASATSLGSSRRVLPRPTIVSSLSALLSTARALPSSIRTSPGSNSS